MKEFSSCHERRLSANGLDCDDANVMYDIGQRRRPRCLVVVYGRVYTMVLGVK